MATKKIIIKQKTAEGYDTLHPETEWAQLTDAPTIPTKLSQLENDISMGASVQRIDMSESGGEYSLSEPFAAIAGYTRAGLACVVDYFHLAVDNETTLHDVFYLVQCNTEEIVFARLTEAGGTGFVSVAPDEAVRVVEHNAPLDISEAELGQEVLVFCRMDN